MKTDQDLERLFRQEFRDILPLSIWQNDNGVYEVFGRYKIEPVRPGFKVWCAATEVGIFHNTKTAMSWCIADKHCNYNLARELLETDAKLTMLNNDINLRTGVGDRSTSPIFRETVGTKLETKIIHKKYLENQLTKYVNWAKYFQQQGFDNEA